MKGIRITVSALTNRQFFLLRIHHRKIITNKRDAKQIGSLSSRIVLELAF